MEKSRILEVLNEVLFHSALHYIYKQVHKLIVKVYKSIKGLPLIDF